jgi:ornithine cyclodeaminase/alanine dehydrogenase-like protein (mu-crystallin family)
VEVIRDAFRADGEGVTHVPPVINLEVPSGPGEFHVKTAHIEGVPHIAVKVASGFYDNPSKGLPSGSGLMALFDASTGMPVALLLDNGFLTDLRTGAAGAVAAEVLARRSIETVGVIGSGLQARFQVRCLSFARILAWSPTREHLEAYCAEMRAEGYDALAATSVEDVCSHADLLITTTPSRTPLVRARWLRAGMHVIAVGADSPGKQELDAECFRHANLVVVDRLSQCAAFGDLAPALAAGMIERDTVVELGRIVAGARPGRNSEDQLTIADLTGVGFQDTAIASAAFNARVGSGSD